jgi:hypothetical protein
MSSILELLMGVVFGAIAGFIYYKVVGCPTGACPITRSPMRSVVYGSLLGLMIAAS